MVVQHFASFVDVTRHKRKEERLRFMLDESNHRTQDTLETVLAIVGQTLRGMADERVIDAFEGRILALSKTHALLGAETWGGVGLREVLLSTFEPLGLSARVSIEGEALLLQPKEALILTMAFHEMTANAMAHGALSTQPAGTIDVTWQLETAPKGAESQAASPSHQVGTVRGGDQVRLRWRERCSLQMAPPFHKGFGRRLIEGGLAQGLGGEVSLAFDATGVIFEIVMPAPNRIEWIGHD